MAVGVVKVAHTHPTWGKDKGIDLNLAEGGKEGIYPRFRRGSDPAKGWTAEVQTVV